MLRSTAALALSGGLIGISILPGCISPLDELDDAVRREQAIIAQWTTAPAPSRNPVVRLIGDIPHAPEIGEDSSLPDSLRHAALNNEALEAAFYRWRAAMERIEQVTTLPDPLLSYGYFINEVETRVGAQQHTIKLAQMFPWFGKLDLRGDIAAQAAKVEFERFQAAKLDLFARVKRTWFELYHLRSAVAVTRDTLSVLLQLEEVVRTRYRVAAASQTDLFRLQVEIGIVEDRLRELEGRRRPLAALFNAHLNRPVESPAPWPETADHSDLVLDPNELAASLKQFNPTLAALAHELESHRAAARLAYKAAYPDLTFSLDYIVTNDGAVSSGRERGDDPLKAGVSVNVPLWRGKYEAGVREALKRRLATASQRSDTERRLVADLENSIFNHQDAVRRIALYRDTLLPRAEDSLQSSVRAYAAATIGFQDVLDAERILLEFQLAERRATADAGIALAEIERLTGGAISATTTTPDLGELKENTP